ncbi:MAG: hypothetical protein NTY61_02070, partial [Candidatus Parcubacteria bacterium]|nr:hypothetical protein [Candidatus Parcubacteria bacterium]
SGFLYQSEKESIPGNYLISSDGFLQDPELPIRYDLNTNKFYCRSTGQEAQQISYYSIGLGNTAMVGAWTQRFAVVCGDNYWIRDGHDWGWKTYGPFQIQK